MNRPPTLEELEQHDRQENRSLSVGAVMFGPPVPGVGGQPPSAGGSSGQLLLFQSDAEDLVGRSLYVQCDDLDGFAVEDAGAAPLFPVVQVRLGLNNMQIEYILDVPPGEIVRVPLVGSYVQAIGRIRPQVTTGEDYGAFNHPGPQTDVVPAKNFRMRAMIGAFGAYSVGPNVQPVRRIQQVVPKAGTFVAPVAAGATSLRIVGDTAHLTATIDSLYSAGTRSIPIPVGTPVELTGNAGTVTLTNSDAAAGHPFEIEFYLGL